MRKSMWAGALVTGVAASVVTPPAGAHHSEPNCTWGAGLVPQAEPLPRVRVEAYRAWQRCRGPRVTIEFPDGSRLSTAYQDDQIRLEGHAPGQRDTAQPSEQSRPQQADRPASRSKQTRKKTKRCSKRKSRSSKRARRCR